VNKNKEIKQKECGGGTTVWDLMIRTLRLIFITDILWMNLNLPRVSGRDRSRHVKFAYKSFIKIVK